jgi:hypothetical protein
MGKGVGENWKVGSGRFETEIRIIAKALERCAAHAG